MVKKTASKESIPDKQTRLNRLLVSRQITGVPNPDIEKLQAELDLLNYGVVKKC